jgi:peptidoglycan/LPS O-acetylase OafA/YrhL
VSILAVVGFHFLPATLKGGFVGVDVFFVISGFLITGILIDGISLKEFYIRRAKRLLPALALALLITLLAGFFLLLPDEFKTLSRNVLAASTFTMNFVLIADQNAAGYFTDLSANNELTHLWSLSIEEQYYLFWPLALLLVPARSRVLAGTGILLVFVAFDFGNIFDLAADRYYFPGTRFWEILAGAWLAMAQPSWGQPRRFAGIAKLCGLALIVYAVFAVAPDDRWPGPKALIPVAGAVAVLAFKAKDSFADRLISTPALVWLGLISYPLYLYHWIALAFAHQVYRGLLPGTLKLAVLVASVAVSAATYRYVEIPVRRGKYGMRRFAILPGALACVFAAAVAVYLSDGLYWRNADDVGFNDGAIVAVDNRLTSSCLRKFGELFPTSEKRYFCEEATDNPRPILIFGDSHAAMLYHGFLSMHVTDVAHLGKGSCAPIWNLVPRDPWFACQPDVNRFIEYAAMADAPLTILTGVFERYFDGEYGIDKPAAELDRDVEQWFDVLARSKHPVLVVLDNPSLPFEPKECWRRPVNFGQRRDCSFDRALDDRQSAFYKDLFRRKATRAPNVALLDSSAFFCDGARCSAVNDEGLVYAVDNNHLSLRGARIVDREIIRMFPEVWPAGQR